MEDRALCQKALFFTGHVATSKLFKHSIVKIKWPDMYELPGMYLGSFETVAAIIMTTISINSGSFFQSFTKCSKTVNLHLDVTQKEH